MSEMKYYCTEFRPDTLDPAQFKNNPNLIVSQLIYKWPDRAGGISEQIHSDLSKLADEYYTFATDTKNGYQEDASKFANAFIDIFLWVNETWAFCALVVGFYDIYGVRSDEHVTCRNTHCNRFHQWSSIFDEDRWTPFPTVQIPAMDIDNEDYEVSYIRPVSIFSGSLKHAWLSPYSKNMGTVRTNGISHSKPTIISGKRYIAIGAPTAYTTNATNGQSAFLAEINEDFAVYNFEM